jgi:hypothetical protein
MLRQWVQWVMAWLTLMPGSLSSLLVAVSARKLNGAFLAAAFMWADAAGPVGRCGQFPVCRLSFTAYAWKQWSRELRHITAEFDPPGRRRELLLVLRWVTLLARRRAALAILR